MNGPNLVRKLSSSLVTTRSSYGAAATRRAQNGRGHAAGGPWRSYAVIVAGLDALAMVGAAGAVEVIRFGDLGEASADSVRMSYMVVSLMMALVWVSVMALGGAYEGRHLGSGSEEYRRVFSSAVRFLSIVAILAFLLNLDISRIFVAVAIPVGTAWTVLQRYLVRRWLHHQRGRGRYLRQVLIVGTDQTTRALARKVRAVPFTGLSVWTACLTDQSGGSIDIDGPDLPVLGSTDELRDIVRSSDADAVLVADRTTLSIDVLRQMARQVEGTRISLFVAPEVTDVAGSLVAIRGQLLAADRGLRRRLGDTGRVRAQDFTPARIGPRVIAVYDSVVGAIPDRRTPRCSGLNETKTLRR